MQPLKIGEAIGRLKERYPRVARYYDIAYNPETKTFTYEVVAGKRAKAEELDGSYLLPTGSGVVLRIRKGSTPEAPHPEIYRLLDVPTQIIKPRKTWTDPKTAR